MAEEDVEVESGRRDQIIDAALESLRESGFAGTTLRSVAGRGGFNHALISYYFGGLSQLLLEALDLNTQRRLVNYRAIFDEAQTIDDFVKAAKRVYQEDLEGGHITVFTEMVSASMNDPDLRNQLSRRADSWVDVVADALKRLLLGSPLASFLPARELATAIVAFYIGVNVLVRLDESHARADALFNVVERASPLAQSILQSPS